MKRLTLPTPPDPLLPQYANSPLAFNRALYNWALQSKGKIESASQINDAPCTQPILATNFTTNTTATGTTTGTDLANVVASLIAILTAKGILQPNLPGA